MHTSPIHLTPLSSGILDLSVGVFDYFINGIDGLDLCSPALLKIQLQGLWTAVSHNIYNGMMICLYNNAFWDNIHNTPHPDDIDIDLWDASEQIDCVGLARIYLDTRVIR